MMVYFKEFLDDFKDSIAVITNKILTIFVFMPMAYLNTKFGIYPTMN